MISLYQFQITFITIFILMIVVLFSMFFVTVDKAIVYSQKIALPKTYHIQNDSVNVIPSAGEIRKTYESKYENFLVEPSLSKVQSLNKSLSYTITNATVTIIKKIANGTNKDDLVSISKTIVIPDTRIIHGKL